MEILTLNQNSVKLMLTQVEWTFLVKSTLLMLTVGRKKSPFNMERNLHRTLVFETPRKMRQSSHSDHVYIGKVCQGSTGIHTFSPSGVMTLSRPGIPSPFTFANQKPDAAQEILSAYFLSVRKPYHALLLPHVNLPPPTPHLMKL